MSNLATTIYFSEEEGRLLRAEAEARHVPLPDLVRTIVLDHFAQAPLAISRADYMSIVGLGQSELHDVADQHDRYLGQALADEHLR